MGKDVKATPSFNALTDAWLPLKQDDGTTVWASPIEVWTGARDGIDLDYPRDDFRVFARLLLSALTQALFAAADKDELERRLERPLSKAEVDAAIAEHGADFELFDPGRFLQGPAASTKGAAPFVFPREDLFPSARRTSALCPEIALVALYAEQAFAGAPGQPHTPGPSGQPGAWTVIDAGSIRRCAWANTLSKEVAESVGYPRERPRAWANGRSDSPKRAALPLVQGLFFQVRSVTLLSVGDGTCSFSGREGHLVRLSPMGKKSGLPKLAIDRADFWQHPCAPLAVNAVGIAPVRLNPERPAWTGLAQLLSPLSRSRSRSEHPRQGPAPVLEQWRTLAKVPKRPRLLVLDFDRDKANVKGRTFESFPLTEQLLARSSTVVERLRLLAGDAEDIARDLARALDAGSGGFSKSDALAAYWQSTEGPFLDWLHTSVALDAAEDDDGLLVVQARMLATLRKRALDLFDSHVSVSEFDPRKQAGIARARRTLRSALFPRNQRSIQQGALS